MRNVQVAELSFRLRAWAESSDLDSAAVELLIAHEAWLDRRDFVTDCIDTFDGYDADGAVVEMAYVLWDQALGFLDDPRVDYAASMGNVLRLALELAGADTAIPLADLLAGLNEADTTLVIDAITHRIGRRGRNTELLVVR